MGSAIQGRLDGKVAIITGGASGIGEATAHLFVKHGAYVIISDIEDEAGMKVAQFLAHKATYIHCDVANEKNISAAVDSAIEMHGKLDIMFNNAGTFDNYTASVAEYPMELFERVMNVNVKGVMHGIKHAARVMIPNKKGCIISTASVAGIIGGNTTYAYTTSKHAVIGLTKKATAELGKYGIRLNTISPYGVATNILSQLFAFNSEEDKGKLEDFCSSKANLKGVSLKAEDVAHAALYLASDEAKYVSGHNLVVDGGFTVVNHDWGVY